LAAEYRANAINVYRAAASALHELVARARADEARDARLAGREAKEPVVVLDLDETVFDNSAQQGRLVAEQRTYDETLWDCWVGLKKAERVPGADLLFREMVKEGVRARFITNRKCERRYQADCPQKAETLENLNALLADTGYVATADELLLSNDAIPDGDGRWKGEKKPRRDFVAKTHTIVMLVGDDFGDFLEGVRDATTEARGKALATTTDRWGSNWFILPNPSYGSWLGAVNRDARDRHDTLIRAFDYPTR
jgi:acid phosphatase